MSGEHGELPVAARVRSLEERLITAGLATDAELDDILERVFTSAWLVIIGALMAAHAWKDPGYRERLLADGNAAASELGFGAGTEGYLLKAVENSRAVHNMIVCTLCSCYPTALLGPSPSWYKSFASQVPVGAPAGPGGYRCRNPTRCHKRGRQATSHRQAQPRRSRAHSGLQYRR